MILRWSIFKKIHKLLSHLLIGFIHKMKLSESHKDFIFNFLLFWKNE